jgi:4a-hydroxytetrahydrobiopterin dehydratase
MNLAERKCAACGDGAQPMDEEQATAVACELPQWTVHTKTIDRTFTFKNFREAIAFVDRVADLAEGQQHHPDIHVNYRTVRLELSTHKIDGLSMNDFILAAKIDKAA